MIRAVAIVWLFGACGRVGFTTRENADGSIDGASDAPCVAGE